MPGPGAHTVQVCAPETLMDVATEELPRRHHAGVEVRRPLPGRSAPVDTTAARELLGFEAEFLVP